MTKNSSSNRAVVPEAKGALDRFNSKLQMNWAFRLPMATTET